jgi:hypothetical protein
MLINVNDKIRMPIKFLWQLIFTYTFDKKSTGHMTKDIIGMQLTKWNGFIEINKAYRADKLGIDPEMAKIPVGLKGDVIDEMEYQLQMMCSWVVREEKDEFKPRVELFKKHKIDFRLVEPMCFAFPEHASKRNMKKGEVALKAAMKANPQDYAGPKKKTFFSITMDI